MKAFIYFVAAFAIVAVLFTSSRPAYARGASVQNSTKNPVLVEEFNARGLPLNPMHLRPGAQRNLRADAARIHVEMGLPHGRPWTQCGSRAARGALRVVQVGSDRCRIQ